MLPRSAASTPETHALPWRLERDVLVAGALRVAAQRIGIGHWQPGVRLRSWGLAPLHREGQAVCVPCGDTEALWLGAWFEDGEAAARVRLSDPLTGDCASFGLPPGGQLTGLDDASGKPRPLTLSATTTDGSHRLGVLELLLEVDNAVARLELRLMSPGEWAACSARTPPAPRVTPPPLPPRLG